MAVTGPAGGEASRRRVLMWGAALAAAPAVAGCGSPDGAPGPVARNRVRTYYIAADTVTWNYVPQGRNLISGAAFTSKEHRWTVAGPGRLGPRYEKAQYRQYTDGSFTTLVKRPVREAHLGILGPVIRAEVGDTIRVVFRNNAIFPVSVHPHGVFYTKANEGTPGDDGTSGADKADDAIAPGKTYTYTWQVPERSGPGPDDPSSLVWLYHDHAVDMGVPGTQAGLVGPLVITRRGAARADGGPADVDHEFFTFFTLFNENDSPYFRRNVARFAPGQHPDPNDAVFQDSNVKSSVNGFLWGNGPAGTDNTHTAMTMAKGDRVRWYAFAMGSEQDQHTPHWHGNTVQVAKQRTDVINLLPATMVTADMRPDNRGIWLYHCHVDDHMDEGMITRYQVR
ncbi:multicopper oxidase domain-containing protein [Streptomyces sp. AK02-01A]|uniref:multicopper oxidase domain-containing protein n=1 Tax=Streptomyces sp. AK02-01A TaxID=3028648 RepID=UPI0029BC476C|nr:multicopper oxidase domain-containing protein [Streptomyces sp. AK02-01A]MDX3853698.1 multicopper oxidase domain-containing protein [Streptomyces sp. AK02-01A]